MFAWVIISCYALLENRKQKRQVQEMLKRRLDELKNQQSELTKRTPGEDPDADAKEEEESAKLKQEQESA